MKVAVGVLGFAIGFVSWLQVARADDASEVHLEAGARLGVGAETHYGGRTHFAGGGLDAAAEVGVAIVPALSIKLGYERLPSLANDVADGRSGDTEISDFALLGIAELHLDRYLLGLGGGWVRETAKDVEIVYDHAGLPAGPGIFTHPLDGGLAFVRGGMLLGHVASHVTMHVIVQLTALRVYGQAYEDGPRMHERAYGASVGFELRFAGH